MAPSKQVFFRVIAALVALGVAVLLAAAWWVSSLYQSEQTDAADAAKAFAEVRALIAAEGWRISFPLEVRFAAGDDRWLSTAYGRPTGYIAAHRYFREDPTAYFAAANEVSLKSVGSRMRWMWIMGSLRVEC